LAALAADDERQPGIERDDSGRLTGRLWRMDAWLGDRLGAAGPLDRDLADLSAAAAARGVTGWTDATAERPDRDCEALLEAVASGAVRQRLHLMLPTVPSNGSIARMDELGVTAGPVKLLLNDVTLPGLDDLVAVMECAHRRGSPVAIHCVTRAQLALTLAALDTAGAAAGDRIEHGAIIPAEVLAELARWRVTVVTQPNFVAERGDQYLAEVPASDLPDLWRGRSLLAAGVMTAAATDAPFGSSDPWLAVRAAVRRRTLSGRVLGAAEAVSPGTAVRWWSGSAAAPSRARRLQPGQPGDLVILAAPLSDAIDGDGPVPVVATVIGGLVVKGPPAG
jgi:predicted amidohydrolase YtcJ